PQLICQPCHRSPGFPVCRFWSARRSSVRWTVTPALGRLRPTVLPCHNTYLQLWYLGELTEPDPAAIPLPLSLARRRYSYSGAAWCDSIAWLQTSLDARPNTNACPSRTKSRNTTPRSTTVP